MIAKSSVFWVSVWVAGLSRVNALVPGTRPKIEGDESSLQTCVQYVMLWCPCKARRKEIDYGVCPMWRVIGEGIRI